MIEINNFKVYNEQYHLIVCNLILHTDKVNHYSD